MLFKWVRSREKGRAHKAAINGLGAIMTIATVIIIAYSKLLEGAWISLVLIGVLVYLMKVTNRHYGDVARQLKLLPKEVPFETAVVDVRKYTIVIVESLNKASLKAINYARQMSNDKDIVAFNVSIDKKQSRELKAKWKVCKIPIPLIIKYSPYREIIEPLLDYIESGEHGSGPGEIINVVMPQFVVSKTWLNVYHTQTAFVIRQKLLHDRHVAVITIPYVLDE